MSELKWVEAERDYIRLHLEKESHFVRDTMNNFQKRLSKDEFIRIHRSTNVNKISEILPLLGGDYTVVLKDKMQLTLSRRYRSPSMIFSAKSSRIFQSLCKHCSSRIEQVAQCREVALLDKWKFRCPVVLIRTWETNHSGARACSIGRSGHKFLASVRGINATCGK
jgi:hypothetical protein